MSCLSLEVWPTSNFPYCSPSTWSATKMVALALFEAALIALPNYARNGLPNISVSPVIKQT